MKFKLIRQLLLMSQYAIVGFLVQCLTFTFLMASEVDAQKNQSIENIYLTLEMKEASIKDVFTTIEGKTSFSFAYKKSIIEKSKKINASFEKESLANLLRYISQNTGLSFKRVDETIQVNKNDSSEPFLEEFTQVLAEVDISGKITDENGEVLPGASVVEKGTTNGTTTDLDGKFKLSLPEEATVIISFVGYISQEIVVGIQSTMDVQMEVDATNLEEVIVVGYGTQKKESITGSISQINSDQLTVVPTPSVATMLGGRMPGLVVKQASGAPGTLPTMSIRGFNTAGESALIIVDGIQRDFQNLDPNEIESITILKDASAAVYGARAASGVILVTTKRGNMGKPVITYNGTTSFQSPTGYAEIMDAKSTLESPLFTTQPLISDARRQGILNGTIASTDFLDAMVRKWSPMTQHNLNVRGGNDKALYFVSAGITNQGSVFKTGDYGYKRYNINSNLDLTISKGLSASVDIGWRRQEDEQSPRGGWGVAYNLMQLAHPAYPLRNPDGSLSLNTFGANNSESVTSEAIHGVFKENTDLLNGNFGLKYNIPKIKGLVVEGKISVVSENRHDKDFEKAFTVYRDDGTNITPFATWNPTGPDLTEETRKTQRITTQLFLRYETSFGDHNIKAMALRETLDDSFEFFSAFRDQLISPEIPYLFTGSVANQTTNGYATEDGRKSYVGRINYDYKGRYFFEGAFRTDAVPRFPTDTRWGFFPGASVAWRISEESFLEQSSLFDNLKLRLSVAKLGNDNTNGEYDYLSGFAIRSNTNEWYYSGNNLQPAIRTLGVPNSAITWQEATTYNAGIDAAFLDGSLTTEFDVFYRKRTGLLASEDSQIPETVGASLPQKNINSRSNRGFEAVVGYQGAASELKYSVSGNVTWNREKYLHYEEAAYTDEDDIRIFKRSNNWVNRSIGYVFDGFFDSQSQIDNDPINYSYNPQPGDIRYKDINGDGDLNSNDRTTVGKGDIPEWMFGLNMNANWKGFDITLFWQGAAGFVQNMSDWERMINPSGNRAGFKYINDNVWSETNTANALFPRLNTSWNNQVTDNYLINSTYFRLKNIAIGYTVPKTLIGKIGMQSARVYVAGTNLVTFDALGVFGEFDPENVGFGGYPQQKVLTVGMNISF